MKLFITFLFFYFTFTICLNGQKNFLPCTIVDQNNVTTSGFINYKNWKNNPDQIEFKKTIKGKSIYFKPLDLSTFSVSDELYVSAIIEKEISSSELGELELNSDLNLVSDTVFLQTLIQGPKSLYYFTETFSKGNFYINNDDGYSLLKYKKYLKKDRNKNVAAEYKMYCNQLAKYFQDCPELTQACRSVTYDKASMEKIFLNYYNCQEEELTFHKEVEESSKVLSVIAGANLSKINFTGIGFQYLIDTEFPRSIGYTLGVSHETILPRNNRRWSLVNDLFLVSSKYDTHSTQTTGAEHFTDNQFELGFTYLKMNHSCKYKFYQSKFDLYSTFGGGYGFFIQSKNYVQREINFFNDTRVEEGEALPQPRKMEFSAHLGLGMSFTQFDAEVRIAKGTGISRFANMGATVTRLNFIFKYHI